jgi:CRP/FNR family cyclic AMP-dependent transcriptional regulator
VSKTAQSCPALGETLNDTYSGLRTGSSGQAREGRSLNTWRTVRKALLFLGILNDTDVDWMIGAGIRQDVPAGGVLIEEGKPIESMFVVLDGKLVVSTAATGAKQIARLLCGEMVGEMSFVDSRPPSASVTALEKSFVLAISRARLASKLEQDVQFAARFYRAVASFLSDRLRSTVGLLGYGEGHQLDDASQYADELDPDTLDNLSIAGARFDLLQRRLRTL